MAQAIGIDGYAQFVKNLKTLDSDRAKLVRLANNAAADVVVQAVRPDIPKRSGRAAGSVRVASTQTASRVKAGGKRAPYYPWLDFGGQIGTRSGKAHGNRGKRTFYTDGRYIFVTYIQKRDSGEFEAVMTEQLLEVVRGAGFEVD